MAQSSNNDSPRRYSSSSAFVLGPTISLPDLLEKVFERDEHA